MTSKHRLASAAAAGVIALLALTACVPSGPEPTPSTSKTSTKTPTPTPTPTPTLDPAGTAEENFEFFESVVKRMAEESGMTDGSVMIQRLVDAGFNKADMELTPNETAIGERSDSVIFAVRFQGECLIGQIFPSWEWTATRAPMLGTGKCLVGNTRPIDF